MPKMSMLEKLKIIFEISKTSKIFIAIIALIIILTIISLITNKKTVKKAKIICAILYVSLITFLIINFYDSLGKMFDYMMNNLFIVIYFPNLAVYVAAIILSNIILCMSNFNLKTPRLVKTINTIAYGIIHYLLAALLFIIKTNNLDVFSQLSIYGSKEAHALIELSSTLFILWIIFLLLYKIISNYQTKHRKEEQEQPVIIKEVKKLPSVIREVAYPQYVKAMPPKEKIEILDSDLNSVTNQDKAYLEKELEDVKQQLALTQEQLRKQAAIKEQKLQLEDLETQQIPDKNTSVTSALMKSFDEILTLEDYKILATILKDKQRKRAEAQAKEQEQMKFTQLENAYKSIH